MSPDLRAGDADREHYAQRVRRAREEGRLDPDEFVTRLEQVYAARTFADLEATVVDLPPESAPAAASVSRPPIQPTPVVLRRSARDANLRKAWTAWTFAVAVNVVVWALVWLSSSAGAPYFWPMWVAGPWGAVLVVLTLTTREDP